MDSNKVISLSESENIKSKQLVRHQLIRNIKFSKLINKGRFGHIYYMKSKSFEQGMVCKIQTPTEQQKESVLREIQIMRELSGFKMFVQFFDSVHSPIAEGRSEIFIYMEYFDGLSLKAALKHRSPENYVLCLMLWQVGLALRYMHGKNIIHRDINESNILMNKRGQVRIIDFGSAVYGPTATGECGLLTHWPPEMAAGKPYGFAVDYFSVGATFYSIVYGMSIPDYIRCIDPNALPESVPKGVENGFLYFPFPDHKPLMMILEDLLYPLPQYRLGDEDFLNHPLFGKSQQYLNELITTGAKGSFVRKAKNINELTKHLVESDKEERIKMGCNCLRMCYKASSFVLLPCLCIYCILESTCNLFKHPTKCRHHNR